MEFFRMPPATMEAAREGAKIFCSKGGKVVQRSAEGKPLGLLESLRVIAGKPLSAVDGCKYYLKYSNKGIEIVMCTIAKCKFVIL
jgi:hypothetical protein